MSEEMSSDCYRIEVLYFLNPHLIWVEVTNHSNGKEEGFIFEQIGIYGLIPLEPVLDVVEENLQTRVSNKWLPATSSTLKNALLESQEVWFSTTYIDRRSSIFDDNIHKYGEIRIKKANGKFYSLSKELTKSGFAMFDVCLFHKELGNGTLKTKLQSSEAQEVIANIENFYKKKKISKIKWEKSVKTNTVISRAFQEFEMALTEMNLEKHNKELMSQLLQNKMKDFEMCKGIEEESVGRAYKAKPKRKNKDIERGESVTSENKEPDSTSNLLKRKLQLMGRKDINKNVKDTDLILANTINALEKYGYNNHNEKYDRTVRHENDLSQNDMCTNILSNNNKLLLLDQKSHFVRNIEKAETKHDRVMKRINGSKSIKTRVMYGPPGISPMVLPCKVVTKSEYEEEQTTTNHLVEKAEDSTIKEDMYANVDSDVNIEITNDFFKNLNQEIKKGNDHITIGKNFSDSIREEIKDTSKQCNINNACYDDSSSDVPIQSSKSKVLKKKLMFHQEKVAKILNSSLTSDTTNKDSSSSNEEIIINQKDKTKQIMENSDDEDMDKINKIINKEYPIVYNLNETKISKCQNNMENYNNAMKNFVNPFKNTDPCISPFTDKVVTPVLMVHTKMNKRIEPVLKISDVHFNMHIQVVLRSMSIIRPMMLQTISWFCILRGYSMIMVSPPGSGKTLGYLPAICRLISDTCPDDDLGLGPKCIIVCASAKSVADVERMAKMFLGVKEKVLSCFAGVNETFVSTCLLNGCDLLISTPSFLVRLLRITDFGIDMRRLATVVMDDCERLSGVYRNEMKYILYRIKESIRNRTNKELKVQYVLASRIWSDIMEPIAKKAPYSVVCIGAFQECVLYSKANVSINFVQKDNKINSVHEFLNSIDISKKIVIVCKTDIEVNTLRKALGKCNNPIFACDSTYTIQDLYNLSVALNDYENPLLGPILLCCDDTLIHLNITDAHYLLNYSLPQLFSAFCKRFSVLNDNYRDIFKDGSSNVKIKILIEETNTEQLPKMINFIKRCTDNIPEYLNKICDNVLVEKDSVKASNLVPICDNLLSLGYCADFWNCHSRHTIFKVYDDSKEWVPKTGQITFKILHYHSAVLFSVRLLSNIVNGTGKKYPQTYSTLSLKMGWFYSKESNKKPHGIPKVGDVCAVSMKQNLFVRCQILKILSHYPRGNPNSVLVKLIDEETLEITRDIYLYYLPDDLKNIETHVIQVRLASIQPRDRDVTFSNLARDQLKKITDTHDELFLRGQAVMAIGNCVFVKTLEACQELSSLNKTVVKYDFKHDLLEKHAILNEEHMNHIKKLCKGKIFAEEMPHNELLELPKESAITLPRGTWAHLDSDNISLIFFGSAISPHKFFVRLEKFNSSLNLLIKDIQKYVTENPDPLEDVNVNDIVLAMFPDDKMYERARIETVINENKVQCFFLDQGDWREVSYQHLVPIKEEFITKMPFQAIECRLVGVKPAGDDWTDFSTNWFCDKCFDDTTDDLKPLYVKYFYKEKAECTGGNKYGIVMIDTNGDVDLVINQLLIDVNLAQENINEMKYLNEFQLYTNGNSKSNSDKCSLNEDHDITENFAKCAKPEATEPCSTSTLQTLFQKPIRSVPLVDSDCEDEDSDGAERWQVNMTDDFFKMFKPAKNSVLPKSNLIPIATGKATSNLKDKADEIQSIYFPKVSLQPKSALKELDSDDYTSPECSDSVNVPVKAAKTSSGVDQMRKPRLIWRQNRNFVVIKINLIGLQTYDLTIQGKSLAFGASTNDVDYAFDFELYGAIDVNNSSHCNKGQYVLIKLGKILNKNWLTLTKDGAIRKWIVYDVESIDVSSDEDAAEEQDKNAMLNIIKNIHNQDEIESEDDDFMDDLNYGHKREKVLFHE